VSVSSVSNSSLLQGLEEWASMMKKVQSEFSQLGQDPSSGNVTQAKSDYTTLRQDLAEFPSSITSRDTTSLSDAFAALGSDLASGDISAAQSDYATLQQDLKQMSNQGPPPPPPPNTDSTSSSDSTSISSLLQEFSTLGQALSSGDLTSAQTAYTALEQELQQLGLSMTSSSATSSVSVNG
jgi:hypothetical protein